VNGLLIADIHNLLIAFLATLSAGLTWTDSVNFQGCQSGIPTLLHTNRRYSVSGEVMFEGKPAVLVLRTDTSRSHGEGGLEQHRMTIDATGTGTAAYYLNPVTGQVSHISLNQILDLGVSTTAREYHFKQTSKQELRLAP
jgi:hypothetical protein